MITVDEAKQIVTEYRVALANKIDSFMKETYPTLLNLVMDEIEAQIKNTAMHGRTTISYDIAHNRDISVLSIKEKILEYVSRKENKSYYELQGKLTAQVINALIEYIEKTFIKQGFSVSAWGKKDTSGNWFTNNL